MKQSYVQVYTGDGKGKTSAAAGLAVRAAGSGLRVKFAQFLKGQDTGEMHVLQNLGGVDFMRFCDCVKFFNAMTAGDKAAMRKQALEALPVIAGWCGQADVIVLDEALGMVENGFLTDDELCSLIDNRQGSEMVLTGRVLPQSVAEKAHLITDMKSVKHHMDIGVKARRGIEY